jgi:Ca-activated chloride channel family protein
MLEPVAIAATRDQEPFLAAAAEVVARHAIDGHRYNFFYCDDDDAIIDGVVGRDFRYFCLSSLFVLPELERRLQQRSRPFGDDTFDIVSFAATPVVLMVSPQVHGHLREVDGHVGWRSLLAKEPPVHLMHAHVATPDGMAVLMALATATGDDLERWSIDVASQSPDGFVDRIQQTVMEYGPDDAAVVRHGLPEGRWRADVLALRERSAFNAAVYNPDLPAVVVHPYDGTAWAHHAMFRVRTEQPADDAAFFELADALRGTELNDIYRSHGLWPTNHERDPSSRTGQLHRTRAANRPTPPANLQVAGDPGLPPSPPARRLLRVLRGYGAGVKRSSDVCLVLDTSRSMLGAPLAAAKHGLLTFLDRLEGPDANVCLILFDSRPMTAVPLQPVTIGRAAVETALAQATASGGTALLDAVGLALDVLHGTDSTGNIKALVVLTDCEENRSLSTVNGASHRLGTTEQVFFGIAYGDHAGRELLTMLARASGGHSLVTDKDGIDAAYETLSRHL